MPAADVDAYLAEFQGSQRTTLDRVRALIGEEVPDAVESISYSIPAYTLGGARMIYFAGWSKHYALYPLGHRANGLLAAELARFASSKGTVRIPWTEFPDDLLRRLVRLRREDAEEGR